VGLIGAFLYSPDPTRGIPLATDNVIYVALAASLAALGLAAFYARYVMAAHPGNDRMIEISAAIREGSMAFLRREYTWVAVFVAALAALIGFLLPWGALGAPAFVFGALLSAAAGFAGLRIATAANSRTAEAARIGGAAHALPLAFRGGAVMGFTVAGLGLLGLVVGFLVTNVWLDRPEWPQIVTAIALGGSSVALFARVGGGIYTKAADVGADLVGKVEAGIPEDDPRNPAVIADNVGANVGDVAGMGADLFESYVGALVAPIAYASLAFAGSVFLPHLIMFPLAVAALGMAASVGASFLVRPTLPRLWSDNLGTALRVASLGAATITTIGVLPLAWWLFGGLPGVAHPSGLFLAVVVGLVVGLAIGQISEWFTSDHFKVVKEVARNSQTGAATLLISGIAEGMRSSAYSVVLVAGGIVGAFAAGDWAMGEGGGVYGVSIAAIGVLATLGITISVDAYGPIADNAGGIAEMARLPEEVRQATDALDSLGNTTAAVAKGFAIASAAVTALALFSAFSEAVSLDSINLVNPATTAGLFIGGAFPFLFTAFTMNAVGRTANKMIEEVRRQFREIPGLREGRPGVRAQYAKCVDISTAGALREMVLPVLLTIATPIAIGLVDVAALGGFLAGALVTGFLLAIFMANAGGAWDNAKKFIEAGAFGGKGSDAHKAAVIGDTVGDPFKDTSGPAMNIVIKVMTIVSLIFVSAFVG
jgi:K(+)-stimulated pyrophosphate-energized sodium pump